MARAAEVWGVHMSRRRPKADRDGKRFVALPVAVIESPGYRAASGNAIKLLLQLAAQFKGRNNGDLAMPWKLANSQGWTSKDVLARAKRDLLAKGLIVETRKGGRPHKASLYALSWQALDECGGKLDMSPAAFAQSRGAYALFDISGNNFGAPPDGPKSPARRAIQATAKQPEPRQTGHTGPKSPIQSPATRAPSKNIPGSTALQRGRQGVGSGVGSGGVPVGALASGGAVALPSARIVMAMLAAEWGMSPHGAEPNQWPDSPSRGTPLTYEPDAEPLPDYGESQDAAGEAYA